MSEDNIRRQVALLWVSFGSDEAGVFADIAVFIPDTIQDHANCDKLHQLSTGMKFVSVNGKLTLEDGVATGAACLRLVFISRQSIAYAIQSLNESTRSSGYQPWGNADQNSPISDRVH